VSETTGQATTALLLVYNGDSGFLSRSFDYLHKLTSPGTYECSLCALTYGPFGMRRDWRRFLTTLRLPVRFLHRDQFREQYPLAVAESFPAVFVAAPTAQPRQVVAARQLNAIGSLRELQQLMSKIDAQAQQPAPLPSP